MNFLHIFLTRKQKNIKNPHSIRNKINDIYDLLNYLVILNIIFFQKVTNKIYATQNRNFSKYDLIPRIPEVFVDVHFQSYFEHFVHNKLIK